ncbi:hypothetical protein Leryth_021817 [Lithospermum erythrorhizon]|nr:hypothetical protein Leryth_021817 [Lithospermum erythrorhizon]
MEPLPYHHQQRCRLPDHYHLPHHHHHVYLPPPPPPPFSFPYRCPPASPPRHPPTSYARESLHHYIDRFRNTYSKWPLHLPHDEREYNRYSVNKKPIQKKSALHRIQLGCISRNKNRREPSPVELDVSFKSNSLVAKALATPVKRYDPPSCLGKTINIGSASTMVGKAAPPLSPNVKASASSQRKKRKKKKKKTIAAPSLEPNDVPAVSSISAGTIYSDSSAFCSQVEAITLDLPAQACTSNNKYDSTMLPLECRPAHSSFQKLFDSSEHSSLSEFVSLEKAYTRGSPKEMEPGQPSKKEMENPMHHVCQPADINHCSSTCDFGCTVTCPDPKCDRKDEDITHDYVIFSDAGLNEVSVSQTTLLPRNKPCENVPDVCGSRDTNTACEENGFVLSPGLLCNNNIGCNKSNFVLQNDLASDCPHKIVNQLAAPFQKGVGRESTDTIVSVDSFEVYSAASGRKRKSIVGDLPVTTGSCVGIETACNCCLTNVSSAKESNLDKNNSTSSLANFAGGPADVSLPDLLDDANEVSPRHGKKIKVNQRNDVCDTSLSHSDESAFANIPSLPVSSGRLIQDISLGASLKVVPNNNGSFKECREIDILSSLPCGDPEGSSAVSRTKNQLCNMAIVSDDNMEEPTNMVDLTDGSVPVEINLESSSPPPPCFPNRASTSNYIDAVVSTSPNDQSLMCPQDLSVSDGEDCKTSGSHSSCGMVHQNDKTLNIEILSVSDFEVDKIVDQATAVSPQIGYKTASNLPQGTGKINHSINSVWIKSNSGGNRLVTVKPRVYPSVPSRNTIATRKAGSLNYIARPRTWRRTNNISSSTITDPVAHSIVPQQSYTQKIVAGMHNTYVRKGNSLVRKSSPIRTTSKGVYAPTANDINSCVDNLEKVMELDPKECHTDTDTSLATGRHGTTVKMPKLLSICDGFRMPSSSALTLNGDAFLPGLDLSDNVAPVTSLNPLDLTAKMDNVNSKNAVKPSGVLTCQTGSVRKLEGKSIMVEKDCGQKIMYVKHRRNQLVAAMGTGGTAVPCGRKKRASSPNGYYKRRKNQLVRTSPENHVAKCIAAASGSQNEEHERVKLSGNGKGNLLNSSVWRLYDTKSSKADASSVCSFRAWHHFPWKRPTYLRHFMSTLNGSSLSILSQKLLSRSKETVYTRSTDGFSLRRSKVLSVGGSNLKWSKSTERKLKKADEEVTLAVAAGSKGINEQKMDPSAVLNKRNLVSRKRIFRIGSQRYKMDPTKKTLHRITHEEDKLQSVPQAADNGRKSYVPRKLFFGNDEYVRIGNGNQLVRDPKKRTRSLASEKVRWSLHTVRLRLAKKKKYCQFFTRFGQCNKDDGKCPYIHDPSKIAVCTKFLNGSCSKQNCNLTHEVIPERMPDCSYFLQGLCSNKSCPYRHVHVHPSSLVCEGFLKGFCASGNQCRKKHTYVCPIFEATGECPQGSKCKLHHPKKRSQTKKPLKEQKKGHGRYFVPGHIETSECTISKMLSERCNDDILYEDGRIAEFISLTVNDGEVGRTIGMINEQASDFAPPEAQVSDLEDLIRPIRLMSKINQPLSSDSLKM